MTEQSKLIPILREAVNVVKMVFFKALKDHLDQVYKDEKEMDTLKLAGAVINELFGTPHDDEEFRSFSETHRHAIEKELDRVSSQFANLQMPLTDALRIQFLCDSLEGINNEAALVKAKEKGILLVDRDVPLPKTFIDLARRMGVAHGFLSPQSMTLN